MYFLRHVFFCTNVRRPGHSLGCCADRNAEELREYMKRRVKSLNLPATRINTAGCLDRCALGPVIVVYPEGVWYSYRDREDIDEIIVTHLAGGSVVERLRLPDAR